jgi:Kef-type K+ transport system membrane component KefB
MMADISLTGVLVVAAIAFTVPLVLGLAPTLHFPSVVLEIVAGIVIGPAILGLVEVDLPLQVLDSRSTSIVCGVRGCVARPQVS